MNTLTPQPLTLEPQTPQEEPRTRTTSDVLLAAARYIEEHGWASYSDGAPLDAWYGGDGRGPVCIEGAIMAVGGNRMDCRPALMRVLPPDAHFPWTWNDEEGRTEAEVLSALREAARSL